MKSRALSTPPSMTLSPLDALVQGTRGSREVDYATLAAYVAAGTIDESRIMAVLKRLEDSGIEIVDPGAGRDVDRSKRKRLRHAADEPVQSYLDWMGSVSLLTREGEVELARIIEHGRLEVYDLVLASGLSSPGMDELVERVGLKEVRAQDAVLAPPFDQVMSSILSQGRRDPANGNASLDAESSSSPRKKRESDIDRSTRALRALAERMEVSLARVEQAKAEMVEANLRLVVAIAKKYLKRGLPFMDLVQEGNMGLMRAIDKFDYRRGYKLSTYASWWIRQAMARAATDQAKTIRIPVHACELLAKITSTARKLAGALGRDPTAEELAQRLEVPTEQVNDLILVARDTISLETPVGSDGQSELGDLLADDQRGTPADRIASADLIGQMRKALLQLQPRERQILEMRFGIGNAEEATLADIGREFGLSRERIRQLQALALRKLRALGDVAELVSYVEA